MCDADAQLVKLIRSRNRVPFAGKRARAAATAHRVVQATGQGGLRIAVRLDLLRALGVRYGLHRIRADADLAEMVMDATQRVYDEIWSDAAEQVGATVTRLANGFTRIEKGESSTIVWQRMVMLDDGVTLKLALEKTYVQELLRAAGLPVPESAVFTFENLKPALDFVSQATGPFVVKPVRGGAGLATTSQIRSPEHLFRAALRAPNPQAPLLVEQQVPGDVYRLLICDGQLLGAVRRVPPRVTGDGVTKLGDLIAAQNRRRRRGRGDEGIPLLRVDLDCLLTIEQAGMRLSSIVPRGLESEVKTVTNQNAPRDNFTASRIADDLVRESIAAAEAVGLRLAGVDLVTPDASRPLAGAGGKIIEVNGNPGLHHHYHVADRSRAERVAVPLLRTLLG